MKSRYKIAKRFLIFWTLFIGIGAVWGASAMLIKPDGTLLGMDAMLPYFQILPFADILFQDFVFSGISLLIVNGISNLVAAVLLILNKKSGIILGGIFGVTLMLWICIQFYMFPANFMSTIYFVFGFLQAITGFVTWVFYTQEQFAANLEMEVSQFATSSVSEVSQFGVSSEREVSQFGASNTAGCNDNGENSETLVVYFSRMGYTKKIAYNFAMINNADIMEVTTPEKTAGTGGFWWCGRYAMHKWKMPISPPTKDVSKYKKVIICTPIWVNAIATPIREFCAQIGEATIPPDFAVELVVVHFQNFAYKSAAHEVEDLLGVKLSSFSSIRCRWGKFNQINH